MQKQNFRHPITLLDAPRNSLPKTHLRRAILVPGPRDASFLRMARPVHCSAVLLLPTEHIPVVLQSHPFLLATRNFACNQRDPFVFWIARHFFGTPVALSRVASRGDTLSENEKTGSGITYGKRRMDKRLLINAQVEITGIDSAGNPFTEQTKVEDFSDVGCRFWTRNLLRRGAPSPSSHLAKMGRACRRS